jgi:amino acid adenylation domain-containing protein
MAKWLSQHATSDKVAVICNEQQITYKALLENSSIFAKYLIEEKGVQKGDIVFLTAYKDVATIVAMYTCLQVGCTYVPIDPKMPAEKYEWLKAKVNPKHIIVTQQHPELFNIATKIEFLYHESQVIINQKTYTETTEFYCQEEFIAYIIFTSGSSGEPKGVQISEKALANFTVNLTLEAIFSEKTRFLSLCPLYFDATILDIFLILPLGGTLVLQDTISKGEEILAAIEKHQITHTLMVPSMMKLLTLNPESFQAYELDSLELIWFGGEYCPMAVWKKIYLYFATVDKFIQGYGPTETIHSCLLNKFTGAEGFMMKKIALGSPIVNNEIVLVDDNDEVVVHGEGELVVHCDTLMEGYYGAPELTAKAWLFLDGKKYYRTGDYVSKDEQGTIYFLNRKDNLIKVGGILVSTREIESLLYKSGLIKDCIVFKYVDPVSSIDILAACLCVLPSYSEAQLQTYLSKHLEPTKIPGQIFIWDGESLPLTQNGKTDSKKIMESLKLTV